MQVYFQHIVADITYSCLKYKQFVKFILNFLLLEIIFYFYFLFFFLFIHD